MKKIITYILVFFFLYVWGLIFIRIFRNHDSITTQVNVYKNEDLENMNTELSFNFDTLLLNYPNPFLDEKTGINENFDIQQNNSANIKINHRDSYLPSIKVYGVIYLHKNQSYKAILEWNSRKIVVEKGMKINGIEFLSYKRGELSFLVDGKIESVFY